MEISDSQIKKFKENLSRLGLHNINIIHKDFFSYIEEAPLYDAILLDPPCSSLGVISKYPELKTLSTRENIQILAMTQKQALHLASQKLKTGGVLVYSVCTFTKDETTEVTEDFLLNHPDFSIEPFVEKSVEPYLEKRGALLAYPDPSGREGFFAVRLIKH